MRNTLAYATLFSAALLGSGALAQTSEAPNAMNAPAQAKSDQTSATDAQPAANSQAPAANSQAPAQAPAGVTFVTAQTVTQWRAPKLVGVAVYGPDDKQVGKIKDVLIDHDGAAQAVVIGVGGFLGFGTKDVAVPFAAIQWRTEPRKVAADGSAADQPGRIDLGADRRRAADEGDRPGRDRSEPGLSGQGDPRRDRGGPEVRARLPLRGKPAGRCRRAGHRPQRAEALGGAVVERFHETEASWPGNRSVHGRACPGHPRRASSPAMA